jgi:predicted transcriptional regulator
VRTTVRLNDGLLREAKRYAVQHGRTLTSVLEDALRQFLSRSTGRVHVEPFRMPTARGRLRPGADLDDTASLLDLTEKPIDLARKRR